MRCTTRQTALGALEGTPFPPIWLKRFSELVPMSIFNAMSRTCKRIHQHLRLNVVWKEKCRALPEFAELSDYEKNVWIASECFWYEWWMDRVMRTMPRRLPPPAGYIGATGLGTGTLCKKLQLDEDPKKPVLVIVSDIVMPRGKSPGYYYVATTSNSLAEIRSSGKVKFKLLSQYKVVIRTNGNLSINMGLIMP